MPSTKKIKCLIVEDEPPAQTILKKYIAQVDALEMAGVRNSAVEAISFLQTYTVDLIFLDIQMPGLLGTKFIRTLSNPPKVIFTTAYRKFAIEGFELNAVDYLLKPICFERFLMGVNKVLQLNLQLSNGNGYLAEADQEHNHPFLYLRADRKMVKVLFNDILFIESLKDYLKIVTINKTIVTRQAISSLEEMLPRDAFIRIHRSYIVAISKIDAFYGDTVEIAKNELPIGRMFKHDVNKQLSK
jgi:DNA-binding LytR/AlgR family response regulator